MSSERARPRDERHPDATAKQAMRRQAAPQASAHRRQRERELTGWQPWQVAEGVAANSGQSRLSDRALNDGFVEVVTAAFPGLGVEVAASGREEPLPGPLARSVWVFGAQRVGDFYVTGTDAQISLMLLANAVEVKLELGDEGDRQWREPVFAAFAVAHADFSALEVDVFDAKLRALEEAQAGAVEQGRHEVGSAVELGQKG